MAKSNANITKLPSPERFGLRSFLDLLPRHEALPGQDAQVFEEFRHQLQRSLAPTTAYECLTADNLLTLEWELLQHRRMRDRSFANDLREKIVEAYIASRRARHEDDLDAEYDAWLDAGNSEETFKTRPFDMPSAQSDGAVLAARAFDPDPEVALAAEAEITTLGMDTLSVLAQIHATWSNAAYHNRKIVELEKRCRDMRRDFEALQSLRPIEIAEVVG
jgi:hypothetical protein